MSKESDKKEIHRILHRMVASPFRAVLGDGGGTVDVAGKTGYVWARKLGQEEVVFQAYNRSAVGGEGKTVLVQESRIEGLPGYEVLGSVGGDIVDLSSHAMAAPFSTHGTNPACRVYHNADQSIPNNASTVLAFNSERFDTDAIHHIATSNSRLTCKTAGVYAISAVAIFAANAVGVRGLHIKLNGATLICVQGADAQSAFTTNLTATTIYQLAVNDYVEAQVYQNSGGALNVETQANYSPEFMMARIG